MKSPEGMKPEAEDGVKPFPCSRCGICCRHIDRVPQLAEFDTGNGRCRYLQDNNLCAIYEDRPDICRVDRMYDICFHEYMSREEYIRRNLEACAELQRLYGGEEAAAEDVADVDGKR